MTAMPVMNGRIGIRVATFIGGKGGGGGRNLQHLFVRMVVLSSL
jgi:hypothetical protein